jgi:hypothetical protein
MQTRLSILILAAFLAAGLSLSCTKQTTSASRISKIDVSEEERGKKAKTAPTKYQTLDMTFLENALIKDITTKELKRNQSIIF